jgi:hypothetical protein
MQIYEYTKLRWGNMEGSAIELYRAATVTICALRSPAQPQLL